MLSVWLSAGLAFFPMAALAVAETADRFFNRVTNTLFVAVIPFLLVVGTVIFIYAIIGYIRASGDSATHEKMRALILWSVIGLAAVLSLWALVGFITSYVGVGGIPGFNAPNPFQPF